MLEYTVKQGDCILSIAYRHGHTWQKVWDHPNNSRLKQQRDDPSVLMPGDVVFIPEKELKEETGATDQRHRFRRKSAVAYLRLQLLDDEHKACPNVAYILSIDGTAYAGTTDGDGYIGEVSIAPDTRRAILTVTEEDQEIDYEFMLGNLDPEDDVRGQQKRLSNLGLYTGQIDGVADDLTQQAVQAFQRQHDLEETGELDSNTCQRLKQVHGS